MREIIPYFHELTIWLPITFNITFNITYYL